MRVIAECFRPFWLDSERSVLIGRLPVDLTPSDEGFGSLWALHPDVYNRIVMLGRRVSLPRWQQNYNRAYRYSGQLNPSAPLPGPLLKPFLDWSQAILDPRLNGVLVNWYDGSLGHYIGKHRDSAQGLIPGSSIVTISLGEERSFRMRPWKGRGFIDIPAKNGAVIVIPSATNAAWTHEVPCRRGENGRRISLTLRAFCD